MKIKALITALVLGSSSLAMAAPGLSQTDYVKPVAVAYRPTPAPVVVRPHHEVVLASKIAFSQKQNQKQSVNVDMKGRFTALKITGTAGKVSLDSVVITFANGQKQVLRDLNKTLADNETMTIDLQGHQREITKIALVGESAQRNTRYPSRRGALESAVMITAS